MKAIPWKRRVAGAVFALWALPVAAQAGALSHAQKEWAGGYMQGVNAAGEALLRGIMPDMDRLRATAETRRYQGFREGVACMSRHADQYFDGTQAGRYKAAILSKGICVQGLADAVSEITGIPLPEAARGGSRAPISGLPGYGRR